MLCVKTYLQVEQKWHPIMTYIHPPETDKQFTTADRYIESPQINGHLCLTITLRPAQLILLYNLTLFSGHLSNGANSHLFHA